MAGSFPKPYVNDIKIDTSFIDYGEFVYERMGIGSRRSGLPSEGILGPYDMDHVGSDDGDGRSRKKKRLKGNR